MISSQAQAALLHKDQAGQMDAATHLGGNSGHSERAMKTRDGGNAIIEGCLYIDFGIDQNRARIDLAFILNSSRVQINESRYQKI